MEMQQVRYFLALADTLNFTRAAERCNVSQPALTRSIQQLEAELGGALFNRERQNTHLSELGRMMHPFLQSIQEQAEAAKSQAKALKRLDRAQLKIGAMCTIGPAMVSDLIVGFRMAYPTIDLVVSDAGPEQLLEQLKGGDLNVALFASPEPLDERLHGLPLFHERFVIALSPHHRLATQNAVTAEDLQGEAYVMRTHCEYNDFAGQAFDQRGVDVSIVFKSERDDWVQGMIKAGLGFGFFPEFCVTDPGVVTRDLVDPEFARTINLVTVRGRPHSPAVGAFVSQARRHAWPAGSRVERSTPQAELETA